MLCLSFCRNIPARDKAGAGGRSDRDHISILGEDKAENIREEREQLGWNLILKAFQILKINLILLMMIKVEHLLGKYKSIVHLTRGPLKKINKVYNLFSRLLVP